MHHLRVSFSRQVEIVDQSLEIYKEMRAHVESCTVCDDEKGICGPGEVIWNRLKVVQQKLKQLGLDQ